MSIYVQQYRAVLELECDYVGYKLVGERESDFFQQAHREWSLFKLKQTKAYLQKDFVSVILTL